MLANLRKLNKSLVVDAVGLNNDGKVDALDASLLIQGWAEK